MKQLFLLECKKIGKSIVYWLFCTGIVRFLFYELW